MISILYTRMSVSRKADEPVYSYWMRQMPDAIRDKITKYRRWQDAQACLFGKALLHLCFQRFYPSCSLDDLEYTSYNRPYVKNGFPDFNISHSGEYIVCAVSSCRRIGIDIEEIRKMELDDFSKQFTDSEWKKVQASPDRFESFFNTWTQKEAVIKANGKGLSLPLKSVHIDGHIAAAEGKDWYLSELPFSEKYACHVAANTSLDKTFFNLSCENLSDSIQSAIAVTPEAGGHFFNAAVVTAMAE